MSQAKNDFSERLMVSASGQPTASERIPIIARPFVSEKAKKTLDIVSLSFNLCWRRTGSSRIRPAITTASYGLLN